MSDSNLINDLSVWIGQQQNGPIPITTPLTLSPLSGDAGFRRYFRVEHNPEVLAVYAPPEQINSHTFVDLSHYLCEQGIHAPRVIAFDPERGFLLIENFGDSLFLSALTADNVDSLYGEALLTLLRMQQSPRDSALLPDYDAEKLRSEMDLFPHWFVEKLLGHTVSAADSAIIESVFKLLIDSALEQPAVFVHRDYHSRNLIHRSVGPPGVIDFQDAVWGPITYDLVSLLKDCYVRWPTAIVDRWAQAYGTMSISAGLINPVSEDTFQRWFDWMGLQRHIKVLGIFARLFLRDNKSAYLHDLPLVIRYTLEAASRYPELQAFEQWFKETLLPLCEQQSWYQDYQQAGYSPMSNNATTDNKSQ